MSTSVPFNVARRHFELGDEEEGPHCDGEHHHHDNDDSHEHGHTSGCYHHHHQDDDDHHDPVSNWVKGLRERSHDHIHSHGHGDCEHDHSHDGWRRYLPHSHGLESRLHADARSLTLALCILASACTSQLVGGILAKSSVLRVEALHSALDGLTVVISLVSVWVASRAPTPRYSYGFARAEVLSALISVMALGLLCVKLFVEAAQRLGHILSGSKAPIHVEGRVVFLAEGITLCCNLLIAFVLTSGKSSLNIRALRAHVIADSVENMVVLFAGFIMWQMPKMSLIDPILTLVIVVLIVVLNFGIAKESVNVLLQAAPSEMKVESELTKRVQKMDGVGEVSKTHVWTLTSGAVVGSMVIFVDEGEGGVTFDEAERIRQQVGKLFEEAGIGEATVQVCRREKGELEVSEAVSEVDETSSDEAGTDGIGYNGYGQLATEEELV